MLNDFGRYLFEFGEWIPGSHGGEDEEAVIGGGGIYRSNELGHRYIGAGKIWKCVIAVASTIEIIEG